VFDIQEVEAMQLAIGKHAVAAEYPSYLNNNQTSIRAGMKIGALQGNMQREQDLVACINNTTDSPTATLGCIMRDKNNKEPYGITSMHPYSSETGLKCIDVHTFSETSSPQRKLLHYLSDKTFGSY
jgi:hypothetical protein